MNTFKLWENVEFSVITPKNPHLPYAEGPHIIVSPKHDVANAWIDSELSARTFRLAAKVCKIMEELELAPWFNLQANGNWGLLPGNEPFFHIHVYGRNKTERWGKPLILPEAPKTYQNDPMPEIVRDELIKAFGSSL